MNTRTRPTNRPVAEARKPTVPRPVSLNALMAKHRNAIRCESLDFGRGKIHLVVAASGETYRQTPSGGAYFKIGKLQPLK